MAMLKLPTTVTISACAATMFAPAVSMAGPVQVAVKSTYAAGVTGNPWGSSPGLTIDARQVAWARMRARVAAWAALDADWSGGDDLAPAAATVDSALGFMAKAEAAGLPLPKPFVEGDGEVGFRWKSDGYFASVAFLDDGHAVGIVRNADGSDRVTLDAPAASADYDLLLKKLVTLV